MPLLDVRVSLSPANLKRALSISGTVCRRLSTAAAHPREDQRGDAGNQGDASNALATLSEAWQCTYDGIFRDCFEECLESDDRLRESLWSLRSRVLHVRAERAAAPWRIGQEALLPGKAAVLAAPRVVYAAFPAPAWASSRVCDTADSGAVMLQATRQTAAVDLVARIARARGGGAASDPVGRWLRRTDELDKIVVMPLESLNSKDFYFGRIWQQRLKFWTELFKELRVQ